MKRNKFEITIFIIFWIIRVFSVGLLIFGLVGYFGNGTSFPKTRYMNFITESISLILLTIVPGLISMLWKVRIPAFLVFLYLLFFLGSVFFGGVLNFYAKISWWDDLLHSFSGLLLTSIGYTIINSANSNLDGNHKLSPGFIAFFSFCFAMCCQGIWEIFEYTSDTILHTNMQRYQNDTGNCELFVGRMALKDTMMDFIDVLIGSIFMSLLCYADVKLNRFVFTPKLITTKIEKNIESEITINNDEISNEIIVDELNKKDEN